MDGEPFLGLVAKAKFGKQVSSQKYGKRLGFLLRTQREIACGQFAGSDHQENLFRAEWRRGGELNYRGVSVAGDFHADIVAELLRCSVDGDAGPIGILSG